MSIIPLDKLFGLKENKYLFTKASIASIQHLGNIPEYPEKELHWKVVPNLLEIMLDEKLQYKQHLDKEENEE